MNIIISNTSGKPIYEQITEQMKQAIMRGQLKTRGVTSLHAPFGQKELRIQGDPQREPTKN